ncbi:MAG TPA: EamA family transporter [Solirubrobacteraceae bacterium]|nr:EamA family transporter [Solirubrobacteraceae bacterium]
MAILTGLLAAFVWGSGNLAASRASRAMSPESLLAGISLVGLALCAPFLIAEGAPHDTSIGPLFWLALGGGANIAGLSLLYVAYRAGDVSLVAPIIATEGAVAAVIAIAAGESLQAIVVVLLAVIVLGIVRTADANTGPIAATGRFNWGVVTVACVAAVCFGVGLYATGRASAHEQFGWIAASPRIVGVIFVALPLALRRRIRITRIGTPALLVSACGEVGGFMLYSYAAHRSLAVAAVLGSLFAAFAVVGAAILFGERMNRGQWLGFTMIVVGVAVLSAVHH